MKNFMLTVSVTCAVCGLTIAILSGTSNIVFAFGLTMMAINLHAAITNIRGPQ